jgi:pimeloyl-ACP methyl ester carboxylesterase
MKAMVVSALGVAVLIYGSVCAFLFTMQRSMLFFPTPAVELPGAERIPLQSGGETLRIWARPTAGSQALIYFGGNAEDVSANFASFAAAMPGRAIYLVNYRGYGGSTGAPSEQGFFADALAVHDWVRQRHPDIAVVGCSLGSGVAAYLASARPVERLVLVTPFDSIANVAQAHYRFLPVALLLKDKFDSAARVPGIAAPTLVLIAADDEVIPRERSDALAARFPAGQARVEVIAGATHNSIADSPRYLELIAAFLS